MRFSLNITNFSWPDLGDGIGRVVRVADECGVDTVWLPDHLIQADPTSTPEAEMLEAYTTLGFLAARTRQVRLGTMATGVTFRPPALLIKAVTTLDVLSGGRAWLGVGAGYNQAEADAMGLPLPATAERFERLEETLRLAHQMWSGAQSAFKGTHYQLERPVNSPQAVQRPHPPILIGGMGEQKTLRLVARYADACNVFDVPDGGRTIRHKLAVLARHCDEAGRPYGDVEKTVSTRFSSGESPESFADRISALAGLGIDHVVAITNGPWSEASVRAAASAVAR